jgi:hypothetical protein
MPSLFTIHVQFMPDLLALDETYEGGRDTDREATAPYAPPRMLSVEASPEHTATRNAF